MKTNLYSSSFSLVVILSLSLGIRPLVADSITFHETYTERLARDSAGDLIVVGEFSRRFSAALTFPEAGCLHLQADTRVGFSTFGDLFDMILGSAVHGPNTEYHLVLRDEADQPIGSMTLRMTNSTLLLTGNYRRPGEFIEWPGEPIGESGPVAGEFSAGVWLGDFEVLRTVFFKGRQSVRQVSTGDGGTVELRSVTLSGAADYSRPVVSIDSHRPGQRVYTKAIELQGRVRDHLGQVVVFSAHNGIELTPLDIGDAGVWSLPVDLVAGTNVIPVWALNEEGNVSLTNHLRLFRVVTTPLELTWDDGGTLSGPTNGQLLEIGRSYRVTARPATGKRFGGWNGGGEAAIHSPKPALSFIMQPGMSLHASFIDPVLARLALDVTAGNAVAGVTNGQFLEVGRSYQALARPGPGNVFLDWSGSVPSSNTTLRFIMESNTMLQANFAANPWRSIAGNYSGLLVGGLEDSGSPLNSGTFVLTLSPNGRFSGRLRMHDQAEAPFSGRTGLDGVASFRVARPGCSEPMVFLLYFDVENSRGGDLTGEASSSWINGSLLGVRAAGDATYAGRYTFFLEPYDKTGPGGDGAGSLFIDARGKASLAGTLGDGTPFTASTVVSRSGALPLYVPLYAGRGFALGRLGIDAAGNGGGGLSWFKPPVPSDRYFPGGFATDRDFHAVRYKPPLPGTNALPWTNGVVVLFGGNLAEDYERPIRVLDNQVSLTDDSLGISVKLRPRTGLFTLGFAHPVTGRPAIGKGALLQLSDYPFGAGWFRGVNESGSVRLLAVVSE